MKEKLEIFDLKDNLLRVQDRNEYYTSIKKEFEEKGEISTQVKSIRLLLLNSKGRIYLQKRSRNKNENPGLYDKTIGGHVSAGETWDLTVVRECAEELGFPASIISEDEFKKASSATNLEVVCLVKKLGKTSNFISTRLDKAGKVFKQPFISTFYFGYYDGSLKFVDGESCGLEVFSLEELKNSLSATPELFTDDIKFMIKKYEHLLLPLDDLK